MNKKLKKKWKKAAGTVLAVILLAGFTAVPVFAYVEEDLTLIEDSSDPGDGVRHFFEGLLARTFLYQKSMTEFIGPSLESADGSVSRAQNKIEELIEGGHDVRMLEEALDNFESMLDSAENDYNAAQSLVDLHSGFSDEGRVVDIEEARRTVTAIEPNLQEARETIIEAIRLIYDAIQEYKRVNAI